MRRKQETISIITLGCSKNVVDSEVLMRQLDANNLRLSDSPGESDILIINTCGFIDAAKEESVNTILEAAEMKKSGQLSKLYVAGCLSERYHTELAEQIPEVDRFFGVTDFRRIVEELGGNYRKELLGERHLTTPSHTAYLKISEGCDHPCSFCAIPLMRGKHISKRMEEVVHEAKFLAETGVKELVIIGQDTTYYGLDLYGEQRLRHLLEQLSDIRGIEWIRLMYAFPSHFPLDVIDVIRERPNICNYIDMPVQHASDSVLRSMRRGITRRATEDLIARMRECIPNLTLRTTLIVGYPNETREDFEALYRFVEETRFDRLGVFTYSVEDHTSAFVLGDTVDEEEKRRRRSEIMALQERISFESNQDLVGKTIRVLLERIEGDHVVGRSEADAPEVDNEVLIPVGAFPESPLRGTFCDVTIRSAMEFDLYAVPVTIPLHA